MERKMSKLAVLVTATVAALAVAPTAHADVTWTVQQICATKSPGTVPMTIVGSPEITCAKPESLPGLFIAAPMTIPRIMADFRPGSYSTDPANVWADWVIPDGSVPVARPSMPAPYMWQTEPGVWQGPCPPTCR